MNIEEKKQEIEKYYKEACEKAVELNQALIKMRNIELPQIKEQEDVEPILGMASELNGRTAYILRSLLVQHGNVLFI